MELVSAERYNSGGENNACIIEKAFASDLISDVLTILTDHVMLITGLCSIQTVRTAEMADICNILLVRGKQPTDKMIELAEDLGITLMSTRFSMYRAAGVLYQAGLKPVF